MYKVWNMLIIFVFVLALGAVLISCGEENGDPVSAANESDTLKNQNSSVPASSEYSGAACPSYTNPAITANEEFLIELAAVQHAGPLVTLTYQVCKYGESPEVKDLSHWTLALDQFPAYLAEGATLSHLVVSCGIEDMAGSETCGLVSPDPTTQVTGLKFDNLSLSDGQCQTYTVTLDESVLMEEYQIGEGGVVIATKAGNQNVTDSGASEPGFACVSGPVPVIKEDPEASGEEGCTPGFWKNHPEAWILTGYSTAQTVESVFSQAAIFPDIASATLLDALRFRGGNGLDGAERNLLRAAVASLLNATHTEMDYPRAEAAIISDVDYALGSSDRNTVLDLADVLDTDNNLDCPL